MLDRRGAPQQIADALRDMILSGRLPFGAPLREADLSVTFGVARNTVREGLRLLTGSGLATYRVQHGVSVRTVTIDDARHAFGLRRLLECSVAERAGTLTAAEFDSLRLQADIAEQALQAKNIQVSIMENIRFHRGLVELLGNPRITAAFDAVCGEITLMLSLFDAHAPDRWEGRNHRLLELLVDGTSAQFRREMTSFLDRSLREVVAAIQRNERSSGTAS